MKVDMAKITLKPVGDGCNLACKHCFVAGEPRKVERMDEATLATLQKKASDYADNVEIIWHGGEPMLAGIPFFERAIEIQNELPARFRNSMQSNFTLLNDEWADYLVENGIGAGTSLDGLPDIHDAVRHYENGRGSYDQVMDGIQRLKDRGRSAGAIATLTRYMIDRHMEVYDAFKELGINWQLNPMVKSAREDEANEWLCTTPKEYAEAINEIVDRYLFDDDAPHMQNIDGFLTSLIYASKRLKAGQPAKGSCQDTIIAVDGKGDVYPCGRFTETPEAVLGNINEDTMEDIFSHPLKERIRGRKESVEACGECEYNEVCGTGCAQIAHYYNGDVHAHDPLCPAYKAIYGHIAKTVTNLKKGVIKCP